MILYYENSIKGGMTRAIHHNVETNNKYMCSYDKTKEDRNSEYLDFNNLCRWLYQNYFVMVNLNMLKKYQFLHIILLSILTIMVKLVTT